MNSLKVSNFLNSVGGMGDEERPPLGEPSRVGDHAWSVLLEALAALFRPHAGVRHLGQVCEICSYWYAP
jgi:hypothetical protein